MAQTLLESLPWIQDMSSQTGKTPKHPMTNDSGDLPLLSHVNKSVILIFDSLSLIPIAVQLTYERTKVYLNSNQITME